ncbi:MAG: dTMP kinase [Patescibacteria group bacterium]|nr:dTMP kinase [Patescibacteria group bacterium]
MTKKNGFLITLEGGEGGGKTTQIVRLREKLTSTGFDVIVLREPGGTQVSEQIRQVVLSSKNVGIAFTTEVLLFQAARAQIYREVAIPSLQAGKMVLMDRSRDSSLVYQGMVRGFGQKMIEDLNNISTKNTYPDLTILLDVSPKIGLDRVAKNGTVNRLEMEGLEFHEQVRGAYLKLARADKSGRWVVIDASQPLDQVAHELWQVVGRKLKLKS